MTLALPPFPCRYDADNLVAKNRAAAEKRSEIHDEFTNALKDHSARIAANRRRKEDNLRKIRELLQDEVRREIELKNEERSLLKIEESLQLWKTEVSDTEKRVSQRQQALADALDTIGSGALPPAACRRLFALLPPCSFLNDTPRCSLLLLLSELSSSYLVCVVVCGLWLVGWLAGLRAIDAMESLEDDLSLTLTSQMEERRQALLEERERLLVEHYDITKEQLKMYTRKGDRTRRRIEKVGPPCTCSTTRTRCLRCRERPFLPPVLLLNLIGCLFSVTCAAGATAQGVLLHPGNGVRG